MAIITHGEVRPWPAREEEGARDVRAYAFDPLENITTWELGRCVLILEYSRNWNGAWWPSALEKLDREPEKVRRHFKLL
jgi:hypothetical protein